MALCRLTVIRKTDGSIREVPQVFYDGDHLEPVVLELGEKVVETLQASTILARLVDKIEDPSPQKLIAELRSVYEAYQRGDFVDITDRIDDPFFMC